MKLQLTLSVSLHAPTDEIRNRIMPVNRAYPLKQLMDACKLYFQQTGRRISFEYAMISGVNDSSLCAGQLAQLVKGFPTHVNLIALNPVPGGAFLPSRPANDTAVSERPSAKRGQCHSPAQPWARY